MNLIDFAVTCPGDARLAELLGGLAAQAAVASGHAEAKATAFGEKVAAAVDAACHNSGLNGHVTCAMRRETGPLQVVITGSGAPQTLTLK